MEETATSIIGLTIDDIKLAMGLLTATTTYDDYFQSVLENKADLYIEDILSLHELTELTVNQKRRMREGIALILASDCLLVLPSDLLLGNSGGESLTLGPMSIGAWNGTRSVADLRQVANQLRTRGEAILQDLKLINHNSVLGWEAIGTVVTPRYTAGARRGIRRTGRVYS